MPAGGSADAAGSREAAAPDPAQLIRSRQYVRLLVVSALIGVGVSLACFVDAVARRDRSAVCCGIADGVGTLAVALAAQEAAQRGATVGLEARNA